MEQNDGARILMTQRLPQAEAATTLHLWGIDFHHANTETREAVYLTPDQIRRFQEAFAAEECGVASVVLCTCNRTEIYLEVRGGCRARSALHRSLLQVGIDSRFFLDRPGWRLAGEAAVMHLYRVTAGLESMALGEAQITAQVKSALRLAQGNHQLGSLLMRVFQGALRTSKRIRSETRLSAGPVSVAYIAVEEAHRRLGGLKARRGLLIGAGKTGSLTARHLLRRGLGELTIVNRSCERAEQLAAETCTGPAQRIRVRPFTELGQAMAEADFVLTATGSPEPIIPLHLAAAAVRHRNGAPLHFFDLAVPRDVAPEVELLDRVKVVGLDELSSIVEENIEARRQEVPKAEVIIEQELCEFTAWASTSQIRPTVQELRTFMEEIAAKELDWIRRKQPEETAEVVEKSLKLFIKKVLQRPVIQLKTAASDAERCQDLNCLQRLFELKQGSGIDSAGTGPEDPPGPATT